MATKTIPYEPSHFMQIVAASEYIAGLHRLYGLPNHELMARYYLRGPAQTLINEDGVVIGCGGILKLWQGTGDAWVLATPLFPKYGLVVTREVKHGLYEMARNLQLQRVQAVVKKDFEMGHRWIRVLGFHSEGLMEKYFGGMDFVRYALILKE